ncbi:MAG: hypothetical protein DRG50_02220 [Deltaproteobacteria bacterium]|nr:MAG: hypothetical protein DRG50_02220 [Deltaproteobacteria bacterium]
MGIIKSGKDRSEELRKILVELREEILSKIAQEMGTKLDEDPRMSTISTLDIGDLSQLDLDEDIDYTLLNMYIERLRNVEDALDRLEEGTYGYCEDCGRAIKLERLKVLPFAKYCVQCQERREKTGQESKLKRMRRGEDFEL